MSDPSQISRAQFQKLAESRLAEARILLKSDLAPGAYYLAGYAIECALKAKIASRFQQDQFPNKDFVSQIYTHNLANLLDLAGLKSDFEEASKENPELLSRWLIVQNWKETARYEICSKETASAMIDAVDADGEGLFQWLAKRW